MRRWSSWRLLVLKLALSSCLVGVAIFLAAACCAVLVRERSAAVAFGWTCLGPVAGGASI